MAGFPAGGIWPGPWEASSNWALILTATSSTITCIAVIFLVLLFLVFRWVSQRRKELIALPWEIGDTSPVMSPAAIYMSAMTLRHQGRHFRWWFCSGRTLLCVPEDAELSFGLSSAPCRVDLMT